MAIKRLTSAPKVKTGAALKFRPPLEKGRASATGTRPVADAASVKHIVSMMVVHLARKIMYGVDLSHKVGLYIFGVMVLSVVGDFSKTSSNYMANPKNFLNLYFVKFGWGWTLLIAGLFVFVTSYTYSCGNANVIKNQFMRLIIASSLWYGVTALFILVEENSGICNVTKFLNREECISGGFRWKGFDVSGHCFLLVFSNLVLIEEGKAYLGWEKIKDMIRNEEYRRLSPDYGNPTAPADTESPTVLGKLKLTEFLYLRTNYIKYTQPVRCLFVMMGAFVMLWDVMLICTALYFHIMIEKVMATLVAILIWFILYRGIYIHPWSPGLPGEGPFKYISFKLKQQSGPDKTDSIRRRERPKKSGRDDMPMFMGMPLYGANKRDLNTTDLSVADDSSTQSLIDSNAIQRPLGRRSRSQSASKASKLSLNAKY